MPTGSDTEYKVEASTESAGKGSKVNLGIFGAPDAAGSHLKLV